MDEILDGTGQAPEEKLLVPDGYTEDEWSDLSDTEKEGIIDSIKEPEGEEAAAPEEGDLDAATLAAIAGEGEVKPEPPADKEEPPASEEEAAPPADATAEEAAAAAIPSDEDLVNFRAVVSDSELTNVDDVPTEMAAKLEGLDEQYEAGDLSLPDYNRERDKINRDIVKANMAAQNAQKAELVWRKEQQYFLKGRPEYLEKGEDGAFTSKATLLFGAFQKAVELTAKKPEAAGWVGMKLLLEADKTVKQAFGLNAPVIPPVKGKPVGDGGKPPARVPDTKTLREVPAAGTNSVGDDTFAQIDKLKGLAYEAALEKLPDHIRESYLARA